ncbi:SUMF1/EgtB/PvdO family nonheme iron enzyme [bacterium]|nr:SUMF1/EgtB/PvdO family nonheme iron enzyme [bacterium]
MDPLQPNALLENRYRIEMQVGEGGFGRVYRAFHEQLNKTVAIKELSFANLEEATRTQAQELFLREAQLLSQLTHPNLPRVTDYFTREQTNYLVMDFIEGEHLGAYAATFPDHRIPETEALTLIRPILDALDYLHSNEPPIVHRDIKPNNIIRTPEGKVYLIDFGLAKRDRGQRQNVATAGFASAGYTAPEQYHQQVDPRADLYSVGATLYTLLSGRIPPSATDRALELAATAHKTDPLDVLDTELTDVSSTTRAAVKRLLALDPDDRYAAVADVKSALDGKEKRRAVFTEPISPAPEQPSKRDPDSLGIGRKTQSVPLQYIALIAVGAVLLLGSVSSAAWGGWNERKEEQATATAAAVALLEEQRSTSTAESIRSTAEKATEIAAQATGTAASQNATATALSASQTAIPQQQTAIAETATALSAQATAELLTATARENSAIATAAAATAAAIEATSRAAATQTSIAATQTSEANATATSIAATETAQAELEEPTPDVPVTPTDDARAAADARAAILGIPQMIEIPSGTFLMGRGSNDTEGRDHDFERPAHEQNLPTFFIAETETTNAQFRRFIDDNGYNIREYWTADGWAWREAENVREPRCWADAQLRGDNQSVSCVTWYEAMAYTAWLRAKTGDNYALPTESQWERAARGTEGRIYPWGNDPPAFDRANYGNANEAPRTVRSYPNGATREGVFDLAGNVWEMTRSIYCRDGTSDEACAAAVFRYPYDPNDGREGLPTATQRIAIRGGSFNNAAGILPAYTRDPFPVDGVVPHVGFRIVRNP